MPEPVANTRTRALTPAERRDLLRRVSLDRLRERAHATIAGLPCQGILSESETAPSPCKGGLAFVSMSIRMGADGMPVVHVVGRCWACGGTSAELMPIR
jgi:hypothetical protein